MKCAKIDNNVVVNIARFGESSVAPDGWVFADDDTNIGDKYENDAFVKSEAALKQTAKEIRDIKLVQLTHDFGDGRIMQIRKQDESNIRNAIDMMEREGITEQPWRMADNTTHTVSVDDLKNALISAQNQGAQIWQEFFAVE